MTDKPRVMSANRFWGNLIRQIDGSALRVWRRTEEGSEMCYSIRVNRDKLMARDR